MKLLLISVFCMLLVAFVADGAFKAGTHLKQQQEARMRKMT